VPTSACITSPTYLTSFCYLTFITFYQSFKTSLAQLEQENLFLVYTLFESLFGTILFLSFFLNNFQNDIAMLTNKVPSTSVLSQILNFEKQQHSEISMLYTHNELYKPKIEDTQVKQMKSCF